MQNGLKKELALISMILAGVTYKKKTLSTGLALAAAGLYYSSLLKEKNFHGQSVLITGGSRGLGLSLAWNFLDRGAQSVTLLARDRAELNRAHGILLQSFPLANIFVQVCDVTEPKELSAAFDYAEASMGMIDILVNNAGAMLVAPFTSTNKEDYEALMKIHLYAVVHATQLVLPHFERKGSGQILNICSMGGKVAVPHMLAYDASKFALAGFSQGVSAELAPYNIRVTTAFPLPMRTGSPIQAVFKGDHEKEFKWFETIDNLPLLSIGADEAAKKILDGLSDGKTEVLLAPVAKVRNIFAAIFPETFNRFMAFVAGRLPKGDSKVHKTGYESSREFKKSILLKPIQAKAEKAEDMFNQFPKEDADFNMGIH
jgi:short-subunit dehydrogenase